MKKNILLLALGAMTLAAPAAAQTVYDAAKIVDKDLNGTARYVSMGGAMNALGGDISTMSTNPAGIGIYRSNDVMTSFGLSGWETKSDTWDGNYKVSKTRGDFNNIGLVYSTKIGNTTTLRYLNFGFNYHRAKSFYSNQRFGGNLGTTSQTYQMASQAYGISSWGNAPFEDDKIGWLSAFGYEGYLIDPANDGNNGYLGMYDNGTGRMNVSERGGLDEYDFNVAFNLNDRVYLGLTVGIYDLNYKKYTYYEEAYSGDYQGEGYDLSGWNKIVGGGVDLKLGAIIRPFADSPFRIGLAVHTPTFYDLDYKTSGYLTSTVYSTEEQALKDYTVNSRDQISSGGNMVRSFDLRTPWLFNVSLGSTIGSSFAVDAEYEYQDYSTVKFEDTDGYDETFDFENSTRNMLKGVSTFRIGAEYKPIPEFAIRAGYNFRSTLFEDNAYKDLPYYSIETDTDYANTKQRHTISLGVGYRGKVVYADIAYKYDTFKSDMYPYVNLDGNTIYPGTATKLTSNRSQALLTIGARF